MNNRRRISAKQLEAELAALNAKLAIYQRSVSFGCYTRQALNIDILPTFDTTGITLVYIDIDGLKQLNDQYGKELRIDPAKPCVNERIATSLAAMRSDDVIIGQWFSGDEFIALVPSNDADGYAARLQAALISNGVTATFVILDYNASVPLVNAIDKAETICATLKAAGLRNQIHNRLITIGAYRND